MKKKSEYFDAGTAKQRLSLMKQEVKVRESPKEYRKIGIRLISEQKKKLGREEAIKKLEKKIYEKSFKGRLKKKISKISKARVVSRRVLRKEPRATLVIKQREQEPYRSHFFTDAFEETKRQMFFK